MDKFYPKLSGVRQEVDAAKAKLKEKQGAFIPVFSFESEMLRYNSGSTPGKTQRSDRNEGVLEIATPSGAKFYVGSRLNFGTVKSPNSSTGSTGEYFAGIKVPLMRDFQWNEKSVSARQAQIRIPLAEQFVASTRLEVFLSAGTAYWDWVAAVNKQRVQDALLAVARDRAEFVRKRADEGAIRKIDIQEADSEVQRRLGSVAKAKLDAQKAALKLQNYLWSVEGVTIKLPESSEAPILETDPDKPVSTDLVLLSPQAITDGQNNALTYRPEVKEVELQRGLLNFDLVLARNQRRPALDLVFNPGVDTGNRSIGDTSKAGLYYSIPLRQDVADGQIQATEAKIRKLEFARALLRQEIQNEVATAVASVEAAYDRYAAAVSEVEKLRIVELGEITRFREGGSELFLVNQRERARAEAQVRLLDVRAEFEQALVAFRVATASY